MNSLGGATGLSPEFSGTTKGSSGGGIVVLLVVVRTVVGAAVVNSILAPFNPKDSLKPGGGVPISPPDPDPDPDPMIPDSSVMDSLKSSESPQSVTGGGFFC